jgi:hypothetical protein
VFNVVLDLPAPTGGSAVALDTTGGIGTVPASVVVPVGSFSAPFNLVAGAAAASGLINATLGATVSAQIAVLEQPAGSLVLNEVDYDQPSVDTAEFVEIYNGTMTTISLAGYALLEVNGSDGSVYDTVDLAPAGSLAPGQFLVVHGGGVTPAGGALSLVVSGFVVQNGAPDGLALVDGAAMVDAMCYEGSMTSVDLGAPYGVVSLVSGTAIPEADTGTGTQSLARLLDGVDTGNDDADWSRTTTLTPGAPNTITP